MLGVALCPNLTLRLEVLHALRDARRCWQVGDAEAPRVPAGPAEPQVGSGLARALARAAWPLPAWLVRLVAPRRSSVVSGGRAPTTAGGSVGAGPFASRAELEAHLLTAAAAVHRLSPRPVALGIAIELLDVIAALEERPAPPVERRGRG